MLKEKKKTIKIQTQNQENMNEVFIIELNLNLFVSGNFKVKQLDKVCNPYGDN